MTMLTRYNPAGDVVSLRQAIDRLFEDSFVSPTGWLTLGTRGAWPLIDVHETPEEVVVSAALPGIAPDQVDATVTGQTLTLRGEFKPDESATTGRYLMQERRFGSFDRQIQLPIRVEADKAVASFEHGVLALRIPKAEEVRPRQIQIKPGGAQRN